MTATDRETLANELQELVQQIRAHVPDAVINTRLAHADQFGVVIHAQIVGTNGVSGGGHATAEAGDCAAELAENRALARAMIALGIPPVPEHVAPTPLHRVPAADQPSRVVQFPSHEHEPVAPAPEPPTQTTPPDQQKEPEPEDISWTAFWTWAKANGFANREALEKAIGRSINQLMPGDLRRLAQEAIDKR